MPQPPVPMTPKRALREKKSPRDRTRIARVAESCPCGCLTYEFDWNSFKSASFNILGYIGRRGFFLDFAIVRCVQCGRKSTKFGSWRKAGF